jgi:hypothetical protein
MDSIKNAYLKNINHAMSQTPVAGNKPVKTGIPFLEPDKTGKANIDFQKFDIDEFFRVRIPMMLDRIGQEGS